MCLADYGTTLQVSVAQGTQDQQGRGAAGGSDWRELYELQKHSEEEKRRSVGQRLRSMWAAEAEQRSTRSIKVDPPRPPTQQVLLCSLWAARGGAADIVSASVQPCRLACCSAGAAKTSGLPTAPFASLLAFNGMRFMI